MCLHPSDLLAIDVESKSSAVLEMSRWMDFASDAFVLGLSVLRAMDILPDGALIQDQMGLNVNPQTTTSRHINEKGLNQHAKGKSSQTNHIYLHQSQPHHLSVTQT